MSRTRILAGLLVLSAAGLLAIAPGRSASTVFEAATAQSQGGGSRLSGFSDEGTFIAYSNNQDQVGTISFKWSSSGAYENKFVQTVTGQKVTTEMRITPDSEGRWSEISIKSPLREVSLEQKDGVVSLKVKDKIMTTISVKPGSIPVDDSCPALAAQAVRLYDRAKGGKQSFPVFVVPGNAAEGWLEMKQTVERTVAGKSIKLTEFVYGLPGEDMHLWVDPDGKLCVMDRPDRYRTFVREGFESLNVVAETDPNISQPKYEVRLDHNAGIPMRDGRKLSADIYFPAADGKFPVVLTRTPHKKETMEMKARFYARRGYVCVVQDTRGRFGSLLSSPEDGDWEPFIHEAKDGYDTVEWLAAQPWSTGKVGLIGASFAGMFQWYAASARPPHLTTMIPQVSPPEPFYNVPYENGPLFLRGSIWVADLMQSNAIGDPTGAMLAKLNAKNYGKLLRSLPVVDLDKVTMGKENPYWRDWVQHSPGDPFWNSTLFLDQMKNSKLPIYHESGWFDGDGIGTKLNYLRMKQNGDDRQKMVIGPWGHTDFAQRMVGDRDFGVNAMVDLQRSYLRWFDYWLKGVDNGIMKEPLVNLFVMGSNKWLSGDSYPLERTQFQKWYLSSGGHANTSLGDGKLSLALPSAAPSDKYHYDPGDPTPSPGYYVEPEDSKENGVHPISAEEKKKEREGYHERVTQARRDILVYVTDPFKKDFTFAGPVSAVVYASSSARDADWFARLIDVDPDGKPFELVEGKIRARYRNSATHPELLKPGEVYEYTIDMWHTGITLQAGHRLRLEISSASFPLFSRNLNTGGNNETETRFLPADEVVYHNKGHASYVLLPVIPE
jgi:putative CocE/NonD family hydrolase